MENRLISIHLHQGNSCIYIPAMIIFQKVKEGENAEKEEISKV